MSSILRRRPSAATLISCFALLMALGGVSYGFAGGSIDSREILDNTIRGKDVHQETVTGSDMKDGKLGGADIADDSLGGTDVNEAALGKVPAAAQADNAPRGTRTPSVAWRRTRSRSVAAPSRAPASRA